MTKITKRLSPTNILNIFAKTNQILDGDIQPLLNILICNSDKVVISTGELKSETFFFFFRNGFAVFYCFIRNDLRCFCRPLRSLVKQLFCSLDEVLSSTSES